MTRFLRYLGLARRTLVEHKLRSFLTMLGIIFGVAAVIAMTGIGEGGKQSALREISILGIRNIYIQDRPSVRKTSAEKGTSVGEGLSMQDFEYLNKALPGISERSVLVNRELFIQAPGAQISSNVTGVDPALFRVLEFPLREGRLLADWDMKNSNRVCVIGRDTAARFFPLTSPVGKSLRINGSLFEVVGVLEMLPNHDNSILLPRNQPVLFQKIEGFEAPISKIILQAERENLVAPLAAMAERMLLRRHNGERDFELTIPESLIRQQARTRDLFNSIMLLITGISLLVGGIGIMNIMLASVLERTKEIGIRRGAGATKSDIRLQFLAEAVLLTATGGVAGVALGIGLSIAISSSTGWEMHIPPLAVAVAFCFSVLMGLIFGYYPAKSASEMNPIDALRHE
jgi:putative ABC transport system permease protein